MGTFTISQTQPDQNVWLYPSGNGCVVDWGPSAGNNYQCVDELKDDNDDDGSYVSSTATSIVTDLYLTAESVVSLLSGVINYVQVFARAKSHLYPQDEDGIFKILLLLDPSECTDGGMFKSTDFDLATGYQTFSYIWTTNPSTATLWAWSDIEDLQIGIQCSSPTLTNYLASLTIRPNGIGAIEDLHSWSNTPPHEPDNYTCVDEASKDNEKTVVYTARTLDSNSLLSDLYLLEDHTTEAGTILDVTVFYYTKGWEDATHNLSCGIRTHSTIYWEDLHSTGAPYQWELYSYTWTSNPSTGTTWTWAEVDALEAGVRLQTDVGALHCTQVYVVVRYYAALNPEIRTTQCYMKINYDGESEVTLNKPTEVSVDHERNLKMLNFWSGNRAVFDIGRSKKSMVITGMQTGPSACTLMRMVRDMAQYGGPIETDGLGGCFDSTFRIISFGWKKITEAPETYEWIIELEYEYLDEEVTELPS